MSVNEQGRLGVFYRVATDAGTLPESRGGDGGQREARWDRVTSPAARSGGQVHTAVPRATEDGVRLLLPVNRKGMVLTLENSTLLAKESRMARRGGSRSPERWVTGHLTPPYHSHAQFPLLF